MMTQEEADLLVPTGPGTPCGELMRRYWHPIALSEELPADGAPMPLKILSEDLVLFRDETGRPALLGLHCAHRGADLSYGRIEHGGLRCIYHGWLYDAEGRCLDQPGEPEGSDFHTKVRQTAYPCQEINGIIMAYMGQGEPPLIPNYEIFTQPEDRVFAWKLLQNCNHLQGTEGNIDPSHQSFLHKNIGGNGQAYTGDVSVGKTAKSKLDLYRADTSPTIETDETDYGVRVFGVRSAGAGSNWVKVLNFIVPSICLVPGEMGNDGYAINWQVPIDDTHHWKWIICYRRTGPIDKQTMRARHAAETGPGFRPIRTTENRFHQDRAGMRDQWFAGMGSYFHVHDVWATDSAGPVQDRGREHLAYTDKAITAMRRYMLRVVRELRQDKDKEPPHVIRTPEANRFPHLVVLTEVLPSTEDWRDCWRARAEVEAPAPIPTGRALPLPHSRGPV